MEQDIDVYQLEALTRAYRHAVRALAIKKQQIEELKASQEDAEKMLGRLEEAQKKAEKALWTYILEI
jgi:hypothetical protein